MSESPTAKLERLLPGARVYLAAERTSVGELQVVQEWRVERDGRVLADGHSQKQAIDRACFAWGREP